MSTIRCNVASRTAVRPVAARKPVTIVAQNKAQKVNIAQAAAAVATSLALFAAPVLAAEVDVNAVKRAVCASNPTSKICTKNSFVVSDAPKKQ